MEKTGKKKDGVENRATARIIDMDLLQTDPRKRSFDESVGHRTKQIKLEKNGNSLDSVTFLTEQRNRETDLLVATSIINGKINQLNALASIHSTNVQRSNNPQFTASETHQRRMEKMEDTMFRLSEEIDSLNEDMKTRFSSSTDTCDNNDGNIYKTPNVSNGLSVSRLISANTNASAASASAPAPAPASAPASASASASAANAPIYLDPDTPNVLTLDDSIVL